MAAEALKTGVADRLSSDRSGVHATVTNGYKKRAG